jgi:8-oxo-dGTP diphosphatase
MNTGAINQRVACKAVIGMGGKTLILREGSAYEEGTQVERWGLPGGRIEPGEPFMSGLEREILEETGLRVEIQEPFYVGEWFPMIKGQSNHIVAIFFACVPMEGAKEDDVRLSEEHDSYRWVTAAEAMSLDVMPPYGAVLAAYFKKLAE